MAERKCLRWLTCSTSSTVLPRRDTPWAHTCCGRYSPPCQAGRTCVQNRSSGSRRQQCSHVNALADCAPGPSAVASAVMPNSRLRQAPRRRSFLVPEAGPSSDQTPLRMAATGQLCPMHAGAASAGRTARPVAAAPSQVGSSCRSVLSENSARPFYSRSRRTCRRPDAHATHAHSELQPMRASRCVLQPRRRWGGRRGRGAVRSHSGSWTHSGSPL